jgi:VCBS repeat-containing protein
LLTLGGLMARRSPSDGAGNGSTRWARASIALAVVGALLTASIGTAVASPLAAAFAASAAVDPAVQYLGDTSGTTLTFTIQNTGTTASIGAVEIAVPSPLFSVLACPQAPAGWSTQTASSKCRYRSAGGTADDIQPGTSSSQFKVTSATVPGILDYSGAWKVSVSRSGQFDRPSDLAAAASAPPGLTVKVQTFEVLDAVVADVAPAPNSACPTPNRQAASGAVGVIVVCGRNHSIVPLMPTAAQSSLGGTFVAGSGTFASGLVTGNSTSSRVLGSWSGVHIASVAGTGKTVVAKIGASSIQTSPLTTLSGYQVISLAPTATGMSASVAEDGQVTITLAGDDAQGHTLTFAIGSGPAHGSFTASGPVSCAGVPNHCTSDYLYTPAANFNGPDSIQYTATNGSSTSAAALVSITVNPVNDAPTAGSTTAALVEDGSVGINLAALASDVETSPANLTYTIVSAPGHGTLGGSASMPTYTPAANYNGPDSFTYTVTDRGDPDGCSGPPCSAALTSGVGTVSITVDPVNHAPTAGSTTATVAEDGSVGVDLSALVSDAETSPANLTYTVGLTGPAHGTLKGSGSSLTYTPAANYNGPDSFTYTVTDRGNPDGCSGPPCSPALTSGVGTVSITVDPVNDAPTAGSTTAALVEDGSVGINLAALASDVETSPANLTYTIVGTGPAHGTLSGSSSSPIYTPAANYNGPDSFTYTVTDRGDPDGCSTGAGCSAALTSGLGTVSITVRPVNDAPAAGDTAATVVANGSVGVDLSALVSDVETSPSSLTYTIVGAPDHGTLSGTASMPTYTPAANYNGPDSFTYTVTDRGDPDGCTSGPCDGAKTSTVGTVSITVNFVNNPPSIATTVTPLGYAENDPPTTIDPALDLTDDSATIVSATARITANYVGPQDVLALAAPPAGIAVQVSGDTLTLSGAASPAQYETALRAVTYANTSENPSTAARTVTFTATDDGGLAGSNTRVINVSRRNDPPVAVDDAYTTTEDLRLTVGAPGVLANDTDVDSPDTKTVVALNGSTTLAVVDTTTGRSLSINANGSFTFDPANAYQSLTTGDTATFIFTYTMKDSAGAQSTATVTITITGATEAPVGVADTYNVVGNTGLFVGTSRPAGQAGSVVTGSVLLNDTDADTPPAQLTVQPQTIAGTSRHGKISINADGTFAYQPPAGVTGVTDTFTYTVCDGTCGAPGVNTGRGTINLVIAGKVWYVDNRQPAFTDGTSDTPFPTLSSAQNAEGSGDTVFVLKGDGTSTGLDNGFQMFSHPNLRLVGEVSGLSLDPDGAGTLPTVQLYPPTPGAAPLLTAGTDVISLGTSSTVDGFTIDPSGASSGIAGSSTNSASNATIAHVSIIDTGTPGTKPGLELNVVAGTTNISDLVVDNTASGGGGAGAIGVHVVGGAGSLVNFADQGTISIRTVGAQALQVRTADLGTSTFDDITVTGSASGAVDLETVTGTTTFGNVSLATTGSNQTALFLNQAGNVSIPAAGTDTVSASGGARAVWITSTPAAVDLDAVTQSGASLGGSGGSAVILDGLGAGTFSAGPTSAITNANGRVFEIKGASTGDVSYAGSITSSSTGDPAVSIIGATGGTKRFTGPISGPGPIILQNNTGATIRFDGGVALQTGPQAAFTATGGGEVVVTDPDGAGPLANSLVTTTGTALNISGTRIGPDGLTFQSISAGTAAGGPTNGIVLNNTVAPSSASGGLTVTGTGSPGTGGTIQHTTGDGIVATDTNDLNLGFMNVQDSAGNGIFGTRLQNFVATGDSVTRSGTSAAAAGIRLQNVTGNAYLTDVTVTASAFANLVVQNDSGDLSQLRVLRGAYSNLGTAFGAHSILIDMSGTAIVDDGSVELATIAGNGTAHGITVRATGTSQIGPLGAPSGSQNAFEVYSNTFANNGEHASIEQDGAAAIDVDFTALPSAPQSMLGASGHAVNVSSAPTSTGGTIRARIKANAIGDGATAGSGSATGNGVNVDIEGNATPTISIIQNTIRQTPLGRGIDAEFKGAAASSNDITVQTNDVIPGSTKSAIYVAAGSPSGIANVVRANITGNTVPTGTTTDVMPTFLAYDKLTATAVCQLFAMTSLTPTAYLQFVNGNNASASAQTGCTIITDPIRLP